MTDAHQRTSGLNLPTYSAMDEQQIEYIGSVIRRSR